VSAVSATARELAVIIWNIVVKGIPYINPEKLFVFRPEKKTGMGKEDKEAN